MASKKTDRTRLTAVMKAVAAFVIAVLAAIYMFFLPGDLFRDTEYSTVVTSREGELLGARIASDGQWRFPPSDSIPERFSVCLIEFEDRFFRWHPGVNPFAVARAFKDNISSGRVVSGASTITMQVARMSRQKERNLWQKMIEAVIALRIERKYTKDEILTLYATHAPFGGNVVGIEAAAWRYFNREADDLSWGEAATLAVLPNAPSAIHPGKNREALKAKRDRLLERLYGKGIIDSITFELACDEPLPDSPHPLPQLAEHLTDRLGAEHLGEHISTTISYPLQTRVIQVTDRWNNEFAAQGIKDISAVVIDVRTGEITAYIGNANPGSGRPGSKVDIASAPRSTGSLLKPLLYCALMQEGEILPYTLLPDVPLNIEGFSPQNFDRKFSGAVPASTALSRSLNVPSVHMLRRFGVPRFHKLLKDAGMSTLTRSPSDYGLSLILGGAEGTLVDMTRIYAAMSAYYQDKDFSGWEDKPQNWPLNDRMALYYTFDALKDVNRPDEMDWRMVNSIRKVAWKTGTSYGFRDGWAVGVTPEYAVGVWVGNAYGEGSAGLVGARTAGPVMFDIFNLLDNGGWFEFPDYGEYTSLEVCRESGHLKGLHCEHCDTLYLPVNAVRSPVCPYHRLVNITEDGSYRTQFPAQGSKAVKMFLLPPGMEWYYRSDHPEYIPLPPLRPGEKNNGEFVPMEFIYPENGSSIVIPRRMDGTPSEVVFKLAHSYADSEVFWHLDDSFIGSTRYIHQMSLHPEEGKHSITAVDGNGNQISVGFGISLAERQDGNATGSLRQ